MGAIREISKPFLASEHVPVKPGIPRELILGFHILNASSAPGLTTMQFHGVREVDVLDGGEGEKGGEGRSQKGGGAGGKVIGKGKETEGG